ncbi:helix-turn-helix domain-containing protein, partial [Frankia gtarii]|uniref:helix-turn-helix domain-containing protein n=1 Tax=Frankia gtarii TaxID=2950102 RepID=UPI0021C0D6DC
MAEQVEVPLLRGLIGRALRRRRLAQQRTLRDVAAAALVSMPYLSEIERGRKEASSEILAAICRALGVRLTDLLDEVRLELARIEPEITPVAPAAPLGEGAEPVTARLAVPCPTRMSRPFEPRAAAGGGLAGVGGVGV